MKKTLTFLLLYLFIIGCENTSEKQLTTSQIPASIPKIKTEKVLKSDAQKWDTAMYHNDLKNYDKEWEDRLPIGKLPFPVEKYDTPGNALWNLRDTIEGIPIAGNLLAIGKEKAFFNIIVKTSIPEPLSNRGVYSRNHPNYFGQGVIKHPLGSIDWIAIKPQDNEGYAIVSGRMFDLKKGKTIFVYQNSDDGIDFLQIDETVYQTTKEEVANYWQRIKTYKAFNQVLRN